MRNAYEQTELLAGIIAANYCTDVVKGIGECRRLAASLHASLIRCGVLEYHVDPDDKSIAVTNYPPMNDVAKDMEGLIRLRRLMELIDGQEIGSIDGIVSEFIETSLRVLALAAHQPSKEDVLSRIHPKFDSNAKIHEGGTVETAYGDVRACLVVDRGDHVTWVSPEMLVDLGIDESEAWQTAWSNVANRQYTVAPIRVTGRSNERPVVNVLGIFDKHGYAPEAIRFIDTILTRHEDPTFRAIVAVPGRSASFVIPMAGKEVDRPITADPVLAMRDLARSAHAVEPLKISSDVYWREPDGLRKIWISDGKIDLERSPKDFVRRFVAG